MRVLYSLSTVMRTMDGTIGWVDGWMEGWCESDSELVSESVFILAPTDTTIMINVR